MPRPIKCRKIGGHIQSAYFKPQGIPIRLLEEVALEPDEIEAVRLADLEALYQADAAVKMGISRQTFGNILTRAHRKIASALLGGKALRITSNTEGCIAVQSENSQSSEDLFA